MSIVKKIISFPGKAKRANAYAIIDERRTTRITEVTAIKRLFVKYSRKLLNLHASLKF
jgi:hypothetical protein